MGFLTFGSAAQGLILNNYAVTDKLISISRLAVTISLICSYPLLFVGTRDGLLDLLRVKNEKRNPRFLNQITISILSVITIMALFVKDITFVASISGAILGTSLIFIFPTLMYRGYIKSKGGENVTRGQRFENRLCGIIATLGLIIGGIGTKMAIDM